MPDRNPHDDGSDWGVVFDLDGTLVDSSQDITRAVNTMLTEHRLPPLRSAQVQPLLGEGARSLIAAVYDIIGIEVEGARLSRDTARYLAHYAETPVRDSELYGDARPVLQSLVAEGVRLGVCTNKDQQLAVRVLHELGVGELFSVVVGGDALSVRKPEPEHLLATARGLGVSADQVVFVGDSRIDIECAQRSGVRCVLVDWGVPDADCERVTTFSGLLDLVRTARDGHLNGVRHRDLPGDQEHRPTANDDTGREI